MNNKCIMVRCIFPIKCGEELEQFRESLEQVVKRHWLSACVSIENCIDCWKIEGDKDVAFGISNPSAINVWEFISIFNISWEYTETILNAVSRNYYESAIWSKLCHSNQIFLLYVVEWVNVFTWIE